MALILKRSLFSPFIPKRLLSTVDNKEIELFKEKFTQDWWDEYGSTKPLHAMNKLRVPFIRDGLINEGIIPKENIESSRPLKGISILDVGCGGGILSEALAKVGANVTGLDPNPDIIPLAKEHAQQQNLNINYLFSTIEDHCKENQGKYDAISASEVIEHITEKEQFIEACTKCLKPKGSIFLTTFNKTVLANLLGICFAENFINLIPKGTHSIDKFIEPHRLQRMLEDCNVHTRLVHGMTYNPVTNNWSWWSNISVNYALHAVKSC